LNPQPEDNASRISTRLFQFEKQADWPDAADGLAQKICTFRLTG
jgi:hypothetical protein